MNAETRNPPETVDEEREHFDDICRVSTEEGETPATDCRDDIIDDHEDGRVITSNGDVFLDPLSNEFGFDDATEIRDPPPTPLQVATLPTKESIRGDRHVDGNPWSPTATHQGESFGSFLYRTVASNNIPQRVDHNATDDEEEDQHYQSFGKGSSATMDSCSYLRYTYSDSSVSDKENAHERNREEGRQQKDDLVQRRMDIAGEVIRTLSSADDAGDVSQLKLIAVLGILSSMSVDDDGALKQEEEEAKAEHAVHTTNTKEYEDFVTTFDGDYGYSAQVEEAVISATTEAAAAVAMPPVTTPAEGKEADNQTSVEAQLKELLGLAPDIDYASVVASWDESVRSQLNDVTEKISPVIYNFMESKEVKGINKVAQDIATSLKPFDISINISGAGGGATKKPAPLQTTAHQPADVRPFIRTKSLSPMSRGKTSHETEDAYVSSTTTSNNNSFFGGSEEQMQKKKSINNGDSIKTTVEDVPCLKPSRFKGGALLQL